MKCEKCGKKYVAPNHGTNRYEKEMICFDCYVKRLDKNVKKTKEE